MGKYKVVFHIDENTKSKANVVFGNILNLISDLGDENVEVELVANSEGVLIFQKGLEWHSEKITKLKQKNVKIIACENSLRQIGITKDSLFDNVDIVPAGVSEIVKKQAEGWAYIRP